MSPAGGAAGAVIDYLESTMGLNFTGPRRERLISDIEEQQAAAGQAPEAFLAAVSRPGAAFDRLVATVTVGETYFFRDRVQCDLLRGLVLPEVLESAAERTVHLWSAGCASGEEAFTLAALAEEAGLDDRYAVVGSDASRRAIDRAQRAVYGKWSMRSTTPSELRAHFVEQEGRFRVEEGLRRHTRFLQRNLLDGAPPPGRFDIILCRNLLIYLTPAAVQRAADVLGSALAPGGWLITAAGDPLLDTPGLALVRTRHGLAYRARPRWTPTPVVAPRQHATRRQQVASPTNRRPPATTTRPSSAVSTPALEPARSTAPQVTTDAAERLATQVRALGDAGRLDEARRAAAHAVLAHPLAAELHYLSAVVDLAAGRLDDAASAAARAVYLRPDLPAPHVLLGQVEHARGATARARRSFRNGVRLLAAVPDDAGVELAGDLPAAHLAAVAQRYLAGSASSP